MTFDLGALVPLSFEVRDASNVLVNATTVTLVITLPDLTTTTPTVTNPPSVTGKYQYDYATVQAGVHKVRWTTASPQTGYTDVFDVQAASSPGFLSLADGKAQLNKGSVVDDAELRTFIAASCAIVERYVGPVGVRTVTEQACGYQWALTSYPVVSLTSVTPVYSGLVSWAVGDLVVSQAGVVSHGLGLDLGGPYNVVYKAGDTQVSPNIGLAARIILQHLWATQRGGSSRPGMGGGGGVDLVEQQLALQGFAIPRRAKELLEGEMRGGMA